MVLRDHEIQYFFFPLLWLIPVCGGAALPSTVKRSDPGGRSSSRPGRRDRTAEEVRVFTWEATRKSFSSYTQMNKVQEFEKEILVFHKLIIHTYQNSFELVQHILGEYSNDAITVLTNNDLRDIQGESM